MKTHIKNFKALLKNEDGNIMLIAAASMMAIIVVMGAAIDFGIAFAVKNKSQESTDIAAIAVAAIPEKYDVTSNTTGVAVNGGTYTGNQIRNQTLWRYYNLNYPDFFYGVDRPNAIYDSTNSSADTIIVKSSNIAINPYFVSPVTDLDVSAATKVKVDTATKGSDKHDVVMVFDTSGSMNYGFAAVSNPLPPITPTNPRRIDVLRDTALDMVQSFLDKTSDPYLDNRMASANFACQLMGSYPFTKDYNAFVNYLSNPTKILGKTIGILDKSRTNGCGTDSSWGFAKALEFVTAATTIGNPMYRKDALRTVVFMTDGLNNRFQPVYTAPRVIPSTAAVIPDFWPAVCPKNATTCVPNGPRIDAGLPKDQEGVSNQVTVEICDLIKKKPNTIIYTIAMSGDVVGNTKVRNTLKACAGARDTTDPDKVGYFFEVPDAASLATTFATITDSIKKIVVVPDDVCPPNC